MENTHGGGETETPQEAPPPPEEGGHKGTAIIVPFRDLHEQQNRAAHLQTFIERIPKIFAGRDFHIFIIEQSSDGRKFNRGKLLNIGYDLAVKRGYQVFVFHDVDLIPSPELVPSYINQPDKPVHIARVWDRYSGNPKYIGGAVAFSKEDFERINGFPNNFWGWGGEDDEMRNRIDEVGLSVSSPAEGSMEDLEAQNLEEKLNTLRDNKDWKCHVKWEVLKEHRSTWRQNGLSDLTYDLEGEATLNPHATKYTVDVKLNQHWTDHTFQIEQQSSGGGGGGRRDHGHGDRKRRRYDDDRGARGGGHGHGGDYHSRDNRSRDRDDRRGRDREEGGDRRGHRRSRSRSRSRGRS